MRICYKIHIFGFMSQHLCVSGSFARSMSLDSCLSIHVYLRVLCKIHAARFIAQQPYVSQDPLQDPRLQIHVSASLYLTDSLQDPRQRLRIHVSASLYLRILCKIHVSIHVSASLYLRVFYKIHVFGFMSQHPLIWILYKIHVFGLMSQHLCISGSSARSMSPDPYISPCLRIHVPASSNLKILCKIHVSDSCLSIHVSASLYLRILCKIHVSGSMSQHLYIKIHVSDACIIASLSSDFVALRRRNANFDLWRRVLRGPVQGKQSGRDPRERFAQILTYGDAFCVALRREHSPTECFAQAKRKF